MPTLIRSLPLALEKPSAVWHVSLNRSQHHVALLIRHAKRQHLGFELSDLSRREIDDCHHLPANKRFRRIVFGDLRRGFLDPDLGSEIDLQLESRLARLRERLSFDDRAGADVDTIEVGKGDLRLSRRCRKSSA